MYTPGRNPMKNRRPASRGHTLVEVVISMLLIALVFSLSMPAFLTGKMAIGRSERRDAAADAIHRLSEELKEFVTADRTIVDGPGTGSDGWSLPGDRSGTWALAPGTHDLEPATWAAALMPYQGTLSYMVTIRATPSGPEPNVSFRVAWTEP